MDASGAGGDNLASFLATMFCTIGKKACGGVGRMVMLAPGIWLELLFLCILLASSYAGHSFFLFSCCGCYCLFRAHVQVRQWQFLSLLKLDALWPMLIFGCVRVCGVCLCLDLVGAWAAH